jgi:WD40 repeat protein
MAGTLQDLVDDDIWTCSHTMKGHSDSVTHLAFTGHNEHLMLASVSRDGIIRLWLPDKDPFGPGSIWT